MKNPNTVRVPCLKSSYGESIKSHLKRTKMPLKNSYQLLGASNEYDGAGM